MLLSKNVFNQSVIVQFIAHETSKSVLPGEVPREYSLALITRSKKLYSEI